MDKDRVNTNLAPRMEGPIQIVALDEHTANPRTTVLMDRLSRDRVVKDPSLRTELMTLTHLEVAVLVDADAEPTSPSTTEGDASTAFTFGVTTQPRKDDLD